MSTSMPASLLARITTEDLRALLYGDATGREDELAALAEAAGLPGWILIVGATGAPAETGVPANAVYDATVTIYREDRHELVTDAVESHPDLPDEEPSADALWEAVPLAGEDLEATVARRQAARDIAAETEAAVAATLAEIARRDVARAHRLAGAARRRGVIRRYLPLPRAAEAAGVAA